MKWNNRILVMIFALTLLASGTAQSQPQPPVLSVVISGTWIDLSWTPVQGATGYTLSFAPIPYTGIASIETADMGTHNQPVGLSLGRGRLLCRDPVPRRLRIEPVFQRFGSRHQSLSALGKFSGVCL